MLTSLTNDLILQLAISAFASEEAVTGSNKPWVRFLTYELEVGDHTHSEHSFVQISTLFLANLFRGICTSGYFRIGSEYCDQNFLLIGSY